MEKLNQKTLVWSNFQGPSRQDSSSWLLSHSQTIASALVGQHIVLSTLLEMPNVGHLPLPSSGYGPSLHLHWLWGDGPGVHFNPFYGHFPWGKT